MKGRGKTRIPEAVLTQARAVAKSAPSPAPERPALPPPAQAQRTARGQAAATGSPSEAVKRKVVSRLRKLHPMD